MMRLARCCTLVLLALWAAGCGNQDTQGFLPINEDAALLWDRQTTESGELLRGIAEKYNAEQNDLPVKIEHVGGYGEIFRKVTASIQARKLPAMAVSYESMTAQYALSGGVRLLDDLIQDPESGFSQEVLDDFYPAVLDTNRFPNHSDALLSFPFTKSVLMLYVNKDVLAAAGIDAPPATWVEFLAQARTLKKKTGKKAYAISIDCSTISAMIFSNGGEIYRGGVLQYDQPASISVFELLETLVAEDLAYAIQPRTFDDEVALVNDQVAFTLRTSAGSAPLALAMGDTSRWTMTNIPQGDPAHPATILFGPNVTLFQVGEEQVAAAWGFVKYFTERETMIRWSINTGYLPMRKSVADDPEMQAHWAAHPGNKAAFDSLAFARSEPNMPGWQEVRDLVERAESAVIGKLKTGKEAARDLQEEATAVLEKYRAE